MNRQGFPYLCGRFRPTVSGITISNNYSHETCVSSFSANPPFPPSFLSSTIRRTICSPVNFQEYVCHAISTIELQEYVRFLFEPIIPSQYYPIECMIISETPIQSRVVVCTYMHDIETAECICMHLVFGGNDFPDVHIVC